MRKWCVVLLILGFGAVFAGAAGGTEKAYTATGVVRVPIDASGRITIAHEDIPGLMPAMTMKFDVAEPAEAAELKSGVRVRFVLRTAGAKWTAGSFFIIGREDAPAVPNAAPAAPSRSQRLREGGAVPPFSLVTETGRSFTAEDLRGRLTVLTFIFTRCPVPEYCPALALKFSELQRGILGDSRLAARVRLVSITLDPEFDRPSVLKSYGEAVGANPEVWGFATGETAEVATLTKAFAVYNERNGATLDHTLCTALIDADGRVLGLWRGSVWRPAEVLQAIGAEIKG